MPTAPTLVAFAIAAIALVAVPGPNLIYIITRGIQQGRRAAVVSGLGVELGTLIHMLLATFGLSALIASSPVLYDIVKFAGAGYLVWLGISLVRKRRSSTPDAIEVRPASMRTIFAHGLVINLLNPKVILFIHGPVAAIRRSGAGIYGQPDAGVGSGSGSCRDHR